MECRNKGVVHSQFGCHWMPFTIGRAECAGEGWMGPATKMMENTIQNGIQKKLPKTIGINFIRQNLYIAMEKIGSSYTTFTPSMAFVYILLLLLQSQVLRKLLNQPAAAPAEPMFEWAQPAN